MPAPRGSQTNRCAMQRAIFANGGEHTGNKWVTEYGDQ